MQDGVIFPVIRLAVAVAFWDGDSFMIGQCQQSIQLGGCLIGVMERY